MSQMGIMVRHIPGHEKTAFTNDCKSGLLLSLCLTYACRRCLNVDKANNVEKPHPHPCREKQTHIYLPSF